MKWTTIRITQNTKKKLREVSGKNDNERLKIILKRDEGKIDRKIEEKIRELNTY